MIARGGRATLTDRSARARLVLGSLIPLTGLFCQSNVGVCPHRSWLLAPGSNHYAAKHGMATDAEHGPSTHFQSDLPTINVQETHGMREWRGVQYRQLPKDPNRDWDKIIYT